MRLPILRSTCAHGLLVVLGGFLAFTSCAAKPGAIPVEIVESDGGFRLLRGGEPYFIEGAVGGAHLGRVADAGGNSVRARVSQALLDEAHSLGLTVMVNLPVVAERSGMDYGDGTAVRRQHDEVMDRVRAFRDHPGVLFWTLGNELDHIPGGQTPNWKVYDALNALAEAIHREDPNHPVMTVIGTGRRPKLGILMERLPAIDFLGVNTYADIGEVRGWLDKYGFDEPYVITEWGPTGHWQVEKTAWGRPIEETEARKADIRRRRYIEDILGNDGRCLGSYSFYWRQKQETTHTWYGMFDEEGRTSESVDVMQHLWTGAWPKNRAPRFNDLMVDGRTAYDDVTLEAGQEYRAEMAVADPDGDALEYAWELVPEPKEYGAYAGGGEVRQQPVPGTVPGDHDASAITLTAPREPGEYRLHAYAWDGHGHYGAANVPLLVK